MSIQIKNLASKLVALMVIVACSFNTSIAQETAEKSAAGLYNEGLALLKAKNYTEGYDLMTQALEKATAAEDEKVIKLAKKNGAVAAYQAGNASLKAKDYDGAMGYYEKGIEMNPGYSSNFIGKGKVINAKGDKVAAVAAYVEGAKVAKEAGNAKKVTEAKKRAKQAVGKLFAAKKYADAITAGNTIAEFESMPEVMYYVARCQVEEKDFEGALVSADKSITAGEAAGKVEGKFYVAKGLALEGLGKNAEAIAAYKKVSDGDYMEQAQYKIKELGGK